MDARDDLAELAGDLPARLGIGRIAQELAGDGGAADPAHDEGLAQAVLPAPSSNSTSGARTPALKAAAQHAEFGGAVERGGARLLAACRWSADRAAGSAHGARPPRAASKLQVWREAPPDSRRRSSIVAGSAEMPRWRPMPGRRRRIGLGYRQCERSFIRTVAQGLPRGKRAAQRRRTRLVANASRP